MSEVYLSQLRLRRDAPIAALRNVLIPDGEERRTMLGHRLLWTAFGDTPDRERDFLWREVDEGSFLVLSERAPVDPHGLFEPIVPKRFAPALQPSDRLRFSLRANATVARRSPSDQRSRGKRCDVVMDALFRLPEGADRAKERPNTVGESGARWLASQGEKAGFKLAEFDGQLAPPVTSYRTWRLDHRRAEMKVGVIDFDGMLTVTNPTLFVERIRRGFGRAKAFGCGLMLIARA